MKYILPLALLLSSFSSFAQNPRSVTLEYQKNLEKITLYSGVDLVDPNLLKRRAFSPLETGDTTAHTPDVDITSYITTSEFTEKSSLDVNIKGDVPLPWVKLKGNDEYVKNHVASSNHFNLVIAVKSRYSPELAEDNPPLTTEAKQLKKSIPDFIRAYGTYFCNAIYRGHYILIIVALNSSNNSTLENYFHEGNVSVALSNILDMNLQSRIKYEVQQKAITSSSSIEISTIGGPDVFEYSEIVNALRNTPDYTTIFSLLENTIRKFNYKNSKKIECTLSDYSSWGIEAPSITRKDIQKTQEGIKKLDILVSKDIDNISAAFSSEYFTKFYNQSEIQLAKNNNAKLIALQNRMYNCLEQLNYGNTIYLNKALNFEIEYSAIHKSTPEIFDYLMAKGTAQINQNQRNPQEGFNFLTAVIANTYIYNSINSKQAFLNIADISIDNNQSKANIGKINTSHLSNSLFPSDTSLNYINLSQLFDPGELNIFLNNLSIDIDKSIRSASMNVGSYQQLYTITIKDKAHRTFIFPFLDLTVSTTPFPTTSAFVHEALPDNCCGFIENFELNSSQKSFFTPETVQLNLLNINVPVSDSLIIDIYSDNAVVNNSIRKDSNFSIHLSHSQIDQLAQNSILTFNLKKYGNQINTLIIQGYSKNRNGTMTKIFTKDIPWRRKICTKIIDI